MDNLIITNLGVNTHIGVYEWEQQIAQRLFIDICIATEFSQCQDDDLTSTVDYEVLCQDVTNYVETNKFRLIETVANKVALLIKTNLPTMTVTVSISKPHAIANAGNIKVTVTR
jgi:dihydroneopterin aldolase